MQAQTHDRRSLRILPLIDEHSACLASKVARRIDGKLRDERLRQEIFHSPEEAQAVIILWQDTDNRVQPHASLAFRRPMTMLMPSGQGAEIPDWPLWRDGTRMIY